MNVLSLFDGMSCGHLALDKSGIKVDNYFASEIDKYAIQVTMANYPETIQLGDVRDLDVTKLPKIDLLIGGSPCQSFSFGGKRKGMATKCEQEILTLNHYLILKKEGFEFEGQSYLFWEYMRILNEIKTINPDVKFLLENVEMGERWERVLTQAIGVNGIHINSALVSAQNRERIYWTNIGLKPQGLFGFLGTTIKQPQNKKILLKEILESDVDEKYYISDKGIQYIYRHKANLPFQMNDKDDKSKCVVANFKNGIPYNQIVVHNMQRRNPDRPSVLKNKNAGGSGHLSRMDGKTYCLDTAQSNAIEIREVKQLNLSKESNGQQPYQQNRIYDINGISPALQSQLAYGSSIINTPRLRRLTPVECERLQTVPDNYTNHVSDSQRYKMLGNGWTIDVIAHIFSYL
jgi:DNA (cytosine-5)-methyltransferase 3A